MGLDLPQLIPNSSFLKHSCLSIRAATRLLLPVVFVLGKWAWLHATWAKGPYLLHGALYKGLRGLKLTFRLVRKSLVVLAFCCFIGFINNEKLTIEKIRKIKPHNRISSVIYHIFRFDIFLTIQHHFYAKVNLTHNYSFHAYHFIFLIFAAGRI